MASFIVSTMDGSMNTCHGGLRGRCHGFAEGQGHGVIHGRCQDVVHGAALHGECSWMAAHHGASCGLCHGVCCGVTSLCRNLLKRLTQSWQSSKQKLHGIGKIRRRQWCYTGPGVPGSIPRRTSSWREVYIQMTQFVYLGGVVHECADFLFEIVRLVSLLCLCLEPFGSLLYDITTAPLSLYVRIPFY